MPDFPYAHYAEMLGLQGIRVDRPEQIADAWDDGAVGATGRWCSRPTPIPNVPPLPPHIKLEQAKAYMSALLHGDPDAMGIIKHSARQLVGQWFSK